MLGFVDSCCCRLSLPRRSLVSCSGSHFFLRNYLVVNLLSQHALSLKLLHSGSGQAFLRVCLLSLLQLRSGLSFLTVHSIQTCLDIVLAIWALLEKACWLWLSLLLARSCFFSLRGLAWRQLFILCAHELPEISRVDLGCCVDRGVFGLCRLWISRRETIL